MGGPNLPAVRVLNLASGMSGRECDLEVGADRDGHGVVLGVGVGAKVGLERGVEEREPGCMLGGFRAFLAGTATKMSAVKERRTRCLTHLPEKGRPSVTQRERSREDEPPVLEFVKLYIYVAYSCLQAENCEPALVSSELQQKSQEKEMKTFQMLLPRSVFRLEHDTPCVWRCVCLSVSSVGLTWQAGAGGQGPCWLLLLHVCFDHNTYKEARVEERGPACSGVEGGRGWKI